MEKTNAASAAAEKSGKKKKRSMLEGSPGLSLFLFALPMILGNLFQQFYNMTDSIIVGRFVGEDALAAVGASYSLTNVFVMIAIGGGIGASVITSQYLGAGRFDRMKTSVYTALITFLGVGIFLGVFGFAMNRQILIWLNTPGNILDAAGTYLGIYFLGMPFLFMYNILSSMFNALGDSRTPLALLIFSSVLNVVLDLWFVLSFGLAVAGVAIATVMAQGLAAVLSFLLLLHRLRGFEAEGKIAKYDTGIDIQKLLPIVEHFKGVAERLKKDGFLSPKVLSIDINALIYQVPGGMLSNLISQLKQQNKSDKLNEVLAEVPCVRKACGYPPLVTPSSQIVGTQAVLNVLSGERYKMVTKEFKGLLRGEYGKLPAEPDAEVVKKCIGDEPRITYRPADDLEPEYEKFKAEIAEYIEQEEDVLSYAVFEQVALNYFKWRKAAKEGIDKNLSDRSSNVYPV